MGIKVRVLGVIGLEDFVEFEMMWGESNAKSQRNSKYWLHTLEQ